MKEGKLLLMEKLVPLQTFETYGQILLLLLLILALTAALIGLMNMIHSRPVFKRTSTWLLWAVNGVFILGFFWICWFHYRIYTDLPLELTEKAASWLNQHMTMMTGENGAGLPPYLMESPPRYAIPVWIENEKYYFWFMCYSLLALIGYYRTRDHRLQGALQLLLGLQVLAIYLAFDPFSNPLPRFFGEVAPWLNADNLPTIQKISLFMRLYPRLIYYYNAMYMWFHPPMLFLSYACITLTFVTSLFMLANRQSEHEIIGYGFAKLGFFLLTLGMLLGYPWALQAWGPNWWWDPKVCSSIMMWAIYSTYLHTRLYAGFQRMWNFSAMLGILCFLAMIFTFVTSYLFPGEHTFQ